MERAIRLSWFYPYPQETIWACLTEPEILREWSLSTGDFRAEPGYQWMETRPPKPKMKWDGKMYFEVLEVVPLQKLSYSFKGGPGDGTLTLDTVVTWTLIPKNGGTELQLLHSGFKGMRSVFTSFIMELGWKHGITRKFVRALKKIVYASTK